jgi:hypothetical protein
MSQLRSWQPATSVPRRREKKTNITAPLDKSPNKYGILTIGDGTGGALDGECLGLLPRAPPP